VPYAAQRSELNRRILSTLTRVGRGMKASELSEHLWQFTQRDVVGRLQVLKRQGMVSYARDGESPSAAGVWAVSDRGRQAANQAALATEGSGRSTAERHQSS
jgi:DNA-binding transcriptional ArsR family regulator